jgi:Holliday junction resolvase RusA-like endonuclease
MTVAAIQWRKGPLRGKVRVRADVYMDLRGDLMNREKQLLDALQGVVIVDDAQVWEMTMVRHLDREDPRVELTVEEIEEAA